MNRPSSRKDAAKFEHIIGTTSFSGIAGQMLG